MARDPVYTDPLNPDIADPPGGKQMPQASPGDTGQLDPISRTIAALATGGASNFMLPGGGQVSGFGAGPSSGGGGSSGGTGAGKSYDPDNMINTYLPGLTPEQHAAVRDALKGAESGSGVNYHKAIDTLTQQHPELQTYTKWGKAFPAQTPGMLTPQQSQAMWETANKYEQPYLDAMQNTSNQMGAYLKQLMPSLPKGYQSLVKAQMDGPGGLLNLPSQVSNLIHEQNPAAIANAYAQYYGSGGTGTSGTSQTAAVNALFNQAAGTQKPATG